MLSVSRSMVGSSAPPSPRGPSAKAELSSPRRHSPRTSLCLSGRARSIPCGGALAFSLFLSFLCASGPHQAQRPEQQKRSLCHSVTRAPADRSRKSVRQLLLLQPCLVSAPHTHTQSDGRALSQSVVSSRSGFPFAPHRYESGRENTTTAVLITLAQENTEGNK